jgi:hypothetical protein
LIKNQSNRRDQKKSYAASEDGRLIKRQRREDGKMGRLLRHFISRNDDVGENWLWGDKAGIL